MTSVGWIDFSSEHRKKVCDVLSVLGGRGVMDELGIGVIRDTFSDAMFPGISTLHTRPKYFFILSRIIREYCELPDQKRQKLDLGQHLDKEELWCRQQLATRYAEQENVTGIIGISLSGREDRNVKQLPSTMYWTGLRTFGLVRSDLSRGQFIREHSGKKTLREVLAHTSKLKGDDEDADAHDLPPVCRLPSEEDEDHYWQKLAITLTATEAEFLKDQIIARRPKSLLAVILNNPKAVKAVARLPRNASFEKLMTLPFMQELKDDTLQKTVLLARDFWRILRGAHIRYNMLLHERFGQPGSYDSLWDEWQREMRAFDWQSWDIDFIWHLVELHQSKLRGHTKTFIKSWSEIAEHGADADYIDELVIRQERANKGKRARLRPGAKNQKIKKWTGIDVINYRFAQVRTLIEDVARGMSGEADPDVGR